MMSELLSLQRLQQLHGHFKCFQKNLILNTKSLKFLQKKKIMSQTFTPEKHEKC